VPWLSAYTMLALAGAAEKKHFVARDVLEQGRSYLTLALSGGSSVRELDESWIAAAPS